LRSTIDRFIYCEPYQNTTGALWIISTWCMPAFKVAPILAITAFTKGAGKSQLLNLIGYLCHNPVSTSNITPAALFRYIEQNKPTVLIDEADTFK
jgi:putative DNA primase/helicase